MYKIGDLIVYEGSSNVCRVSDITKLDQGDQDRLYYVLRPLHEDCVIYNPVDNTTALMRPVISHAEAERLIDMIPEMEAGGAGAQEASNFQEAKQIAQHYESVIKARDCAGLMKLTMSIYEKKQVRAKNDRGIGSVEASAMRRAEEMLFGELSVALDIPRDHVRNYIETRLGTPGKLSFSAEKQLH